eukprot:6213494-Pleurochrysis_carterae.AAC.7
MRTERARTCAYLHLHARANSQGPCAYLAECAHEFGHALIHLRLGTCTCACHLTDVHIRAIPLSTARNPKSNQSSEVEECAPEPEEDKKPTWPDLATLLAETHAMPQRWFSGTPKVTMIAQTSSGMY